MPLVTTEYIELKEHGGQALRLMLNDPANLNAMGEEMASEFAAVVAKIAHEQTKPRCIILSGMGRAFSAGGNLSMLEAKSRIEPEKNRKLMLNFYNSFLSILALNIPLIAAINGHAVGAGLCLASACDVRICAQGAKLGFTFGKLGLHPGMGATYFLPRIIGVAAAQELLLTGRMIESSEALRLGLVSKVVEGEKLMEAALSLAGEIATCGPASQSLLTETFRQGGAGLAAALEREAQCQARSYASPEFLEGVRAAMNKKPAKWS